VDDIRLDDGGITGGHVSNGSEHFSSFTYSFLGRLQGPAWQHRCHAQEVQWCSLSVSDWGDREL
jgi:hypothetical protein